jgi:DNA-binding LacI/PurR family transcriptional regulator
LADLPGIDTDLVRADDESGAFDAAVHLIEQGCQKLAYISGPKEFLASDRRLNGFKKALKKYKIKFNESCVFQSGWRMEDGYETGLRMLQHADVQPDGIFCYNDPVAIGLMRALIENGRRVPEDVAIVGFDDDDVSAFVQPGLTTVAQPAQEIGRQAAQQLFERIQAKENSETPERFYLKTELVVRGSSLKK